MLFGSDKLRMPAPADTLPGREATMPVPASHAVLGTSMTGPWEGGEIAIFGLGCFWGAERRFWQAPGVISTQVGYSAGFTRNPTYQEVCSGRTGHNEVVRVAFDPSKTSFAALLKVFFESHDPTQGMRQGNDQGTQYRSGIYTTSDEQAVAAQAAAEAFQVGLTKAGFGAITTEIVPAGTFYFAEDYHQQYLHKNPRGYCGLGGTGVTCPVSPLGDG